MKETESKYQCIPFWSWNGELDEEKLCRQIEWMKSKGVGGFFMHARGGLKTEYLGEKWFSCVSACVEKANELGMQAYAYDENGWPSGFAGGKLLEDIENHDMYIEYYVGPFDEKADLSYDISGDRLIRAEGGENCLNLYLKHSSSTADILNPEVVEKFMALTHDEYKKRDRGGLVGFFTDEPQYYRWGTSYTRVLPDYFKKKYGEDLFDGLGLLFVEKEGYREFRYRYWKSMQELMLESFAKKVYDRCEKYGYKFTGHYVQENGIGEQIMCCGGVMPFYEYEHIPGIDWLGRGIETELAPKQLGSAAAQLGKRQTLTETFACVGWDATPRELKHIAEFQYVHGLNLMCQHLLPYAEDGQRKRDYPEHFSYVNPWINKGFKTFNGYFSVLGKTLSQSTEVVDVAVLHPLRSAYFDYRRMETMPDGKQREFRGFNVSDINDSFQKFVEDLGKKQIPHHYVDETILARHGHVEGDVLVCGKCRYKYLIIPKIYTMDASTEKLIREYVENGGKVLLTDEKPSYLEGKPFDYGYLKSNITLDEIKAALPVTGEENANIRFTYRVGDDGKEFVYAVNLGGKTSWKVITDRAKSFSGYDILKDEYFPVGKEIEFSEYQSYLLYFDDKDYETVKKEKTYIGLPERFSVSEKVDNYLTLDLVSYSFDGVNYGKAVHHMCALDGLLRARYRGKLYLKYAFDVKSAPKRCKLLIEDTNLQSVFVNGKKAKVSGRSEVEEKLLYCDVAEFIKRGKNEIVAVIDYYQGDNVYDVLFGDGTESLRNCLAYDTTIEPVYLKGDFGVYGKFEDGKTEGALLGEEFYIDEQKKEVSSLIKDGFPFFRGDITLKGKVYADSENASLFVGKRFQMMKVKVNGKEAGEMLFSKELDLSGLLRKGENEIEITLTVGNRNLLGPFHAPDEEPRWIGPFTFERFGSWKDGKSDMYRESYAFMKTVI